MNLVTILAYGLLFWRAEQPVSWHLLPEEDVFFTLTIVLLQPIASFLLGRLTSRRVERLLVAYADTPQVAQHFHHRASLAIRVGLLAGFAVSIHLTNWPVWFRFQAPVLQMLGDLVVLTPFLGGVLSLLIAIYPAERALRARSLGRAPTPRGGTPLDWPIRSYLDFQLRHQVLIVAAPMTLILFAADLLRAYEEPLQRLTGIWGPDAILAVAVACIFVVSPVMLRRIWRTTSLEAGPVRERLERAGRAIGLRFRDILVWNTDGMMINAAVMGVFTPVRYVLLSDGLLESMSVRQIEAVFGHEAGHVRHRHIQHFLIFALVGWLAAVGIMELLAQTVAPPPGANGTGSELMVQGVGIAATVLFWGVGFGWLSRRFERQADLFGASCTSPPAQACRLPCSVHPDDHTTLPATGRVCMSGVALFASALEHVAALNGIPLDERSWRHSSIGSRIRFLTSLAGDPGRVVRFERLLQRSKTVLWILALAGSTATVVYCFFVDPALMQFQISVP